MMGRISQDQGQLFYSFNLEAVVPDDHLVRAVARVLDLSWVRAELAPHYSHTGRPSIDPVLMIRMLIVGYIFAIRSERALCREVQLNLAYRWFCGLGIEDDIPDHSAFSRARNARFRDSDIFRHVFERVVGTCIAAGLVGGEGFAVDASLIQADANKRRSIPGAEWNKDIDPEQAHRAVKEYLATLDDPAYGAASPNGSRRIPPMAQPPTSTGWSTSRGSHRMSRSSTSRSATTGHSIGKTSRSTRSVTFTSARRARVSRRRAGWSTILPMAAGFEGEARTACVTTEFVMLLVILLLFVIGRKRQWYEHWMEYRLLAELIRQLRILIPLGGGRPLPRTPTHLGLYGNLTQTWMYWHTRAIARATGIPEAKVTREYVLDCLNYVDKIVGSPNEGQFKFQKDTEIRSEHIAHRLHKTSTYLFGATLLGIGVHLLLEVAGSAPLPHWLEFHVPEAFHKALDQWLVLASAFLPALAAALAGINNQGEFARLAKRSAAMADSFSRFAAQIAALRSATARGSDTLKLSHLIPLAGQIAEVMVDEVADWRVVFIDRPPVAA